MNNKNLNKKCTKSKNFMKKSKVTMIKTSCHQFQKNKKYRRNNKNKKS